MLYIQNSRWTVVLHHHKKHFYLKVSFIFLLQQISEPVSIGFNKFLDSQGPLIRLSSCYPSNLPFCHNVNCFSSQNISAKGKLLLLAFTPEPFQMNLPTFAKVYVITLSLIILTFILWSRPSQVGFLCKGLHYIQYKLMETNLFPLPQIEQGEGFLFWI